MQLLKSITLATVLSLSSLSAHSLWINSFESFNHKPGHTTVSLGWGHALPLDDILNSPNGKVLVEEFSIVSPSGEKMNLNIPKSKNAQATKTSKNLEVFDSQVGLQKIALKKDSQKGVYKLEAKSKSTFYTQYIDTKDRRRLKLKSKDKLKDIKKVLMSVKYEAFANSYLTLGNKWENPKVTNKGLEIIPKSDLSNIKVGDLVEFEVLFYGKSLNSNAKSMNYIAASSNTFGQKDGYALMSYIKEGKAQIRVQSAGQWIVSCNHKEVVKKDGKLKYLFGKVNSVFNAATLTFDVKE